MGFWDREDDINNFAASATKCPNCAANIFYEPQVNALMCRSCGGLFNPNTMESMGSLGVVREHNYTGDGDMTEADKLRQECYCDSCGAVLVTDKNTASTFCPFCGSPALITRKLTKEFKPDKIVPFKIDRQKAEDLFAKYIASKKYVSKVIKKRHIKRMTALYVPFWLVSCDLTSDVTGSGKTKYQEDECINVFEIRGKLKFRVNNIPFDASKKIANKLMEAIEPFDYSDMKDFAPEYLQGFYADSYDQLPTEMLKRISDRMRLYGNQEAGVLGKDYFDFSISHNKSLTYMDNVSALYCLMPVWFLSIEAGGSTYQFAVNGQTGEVCGQLPDSPQLLARKGLKNFLGKYRIIGDITALLLIFIFAILGFGFIGRFLGSVFGILAIASTFWFFIRMLQGRHRTEGTFTGDLGQENDFDKMPPLSCYFDPSVKADITTDTILLRRYTEIVDPNGIVIKTVDMPLDPH